MTSDNINFLSIKQTANRLNVSKKTLMRWDTEGYFSSRETVTGARVYYIQDVEAAKAWLDLREKHRKHLRELLPIRKALDKFLVTQPLIPGEPDKHFWNYEEMKGPYEAMRRWEETEREIMKEYSKFDNFKYRKIERTIK